MGWQSGIITQSGGTEHPYYFSSVSGVSGMDCIVVRPLGGITRVELTHHQVGIYPYPSVVLYVKVIGPNTMVFRFHGEPVVG